MTESAYEWGLRHSSCSDALEMRKALGPDKTQADWWRACPRGDWLLWQLDRLPPATQDQLQPQIARAIEVIVTSAIVEHALDCGVEAVEKWAARWLSGEDRSAWAARAAAAAAAAVEAARAAAWAARAAAEAAEAAEAAWAARAAARAARAAAAAVEAAWAAAWAAAAAAEATEAAWAARAAAVEAAWAAAVEAAWAAERQHQADDIRAEIPEWPGGGA